MASEPSITKQLATNKKSAQQATTRRPLPGPGAADAPVGASSAASSAGGGATMGGTTVDASPHRWTFLTNHSHVLVVLHAEPGLVLREVAAKVGITERAVQRIIADLEEAGYIRREKIGRQNQYEVLTDEPLRHPIEAHRNIGDLLQLLTD